MNNNLVLCIARIQKPKGLKGQIKVTAFGEFLKQFPQNTKLSLYSSTKVLDGLLIHPKKKKDITLTTLISQQNETAIIQINDIDSPEKVKTLQGYYIGMPLEEAQEKFADEKNPYYFQYLNLNIVDYESKITKGNVVRIEEINNKAMLVFLSKEKQKEYYIPLEHPNIKENNFKDKKLLIENIDDFVIDE